MGFRSSETTSASRWESITSFPHEFVQGQRPKAIFMNAAGNVTLLGEDSVQVTFTPAIGIPIQLRPKSIISTTAASVIVLFD